MARSSHTSKSSASWLKEHFDDRYVQRSWQDGYRSRASYKLLELDAKDALLKPGMTVIDLGAAPGGWSQIAADKVGDKGCVIASDILEGLDHDLAEAFGDLQVERPRVLDGELAHVDIPPFGFRIDPSQVDYLNAHGTSTPLNDRQETKAIKLALGEHAHRVPISSTKSMTGHLLGAGGALESAFCVLSIRDGTIPATINLQEQDPDCDLNYTPNTAELGLVKVAMTNNLGFGGHNTSLVFKAVE